MAYLPFYRDQMTCIHDHPSGSDSSLYWLPYGCICFDDQLQVLCAYHAERIELEGWEIYEVIYWGA